MLQAAPGMIFTTADGWTVDTTKAGFLGMTAHWIQLLTATLNNASSNTTKCETIQSIHERRKLPACCLSHVVNLANIDVMDHVTKIAAMETTTAIWEYDPSLPNNHVLNGSLDVIVAIRTLAIKLFIASADHRYGPITTIHCNSKVAKHIPWSAFTFSDDDWERVKEAFEILAYFSAKKCPTLWCALPAIEELQMAWEAKRDNP
ncbi:hypothetical protein L208DRAFT_1543662 [Tricholoma matsutake]|nr:hypothetical protein L208DRAFT_1543662 [Tricholoma matsutake 945]